MCFVNPDPGDPPAVMMRPLWTATIKLIRAADAIAPIGKRVIRDYCPERNQPQTLVDPLDDKRRVCVSVCVCVQIHCKVSWWTSLYLESLK